MRVLRPCVDLQLAELRPAQPVARQHALDRLAEDLRRLPPELGGKSKAPSQEKFMEQVNRKMKLIFKALILIIIEPVERIMSSVLK